MPAPVGTCLQAQGGVIKSPASAPLLLCHTQRLLTVRGPVGADTAKAEEHCGLYSSDPPILGTKDLFHGRQSFHGPGRWRGGFRFHPLLLSCCEAHFLVGHRPVLAHGPKIGDLCSNGHHDRLAH